MMRNEQLEQQLAEYAGFLDELSRDRLPDLTPNPMEIEGDVTVVELMRKTDEAELDEMGPAGSDRRVPWLVAIAAAIVLIATLAFLIPRGEEGSLRTTEIPDDNELPAEPAPAEVAENEVVAPDVASLLEQATALESSELLTDIYARDVAVTVDGFEFEDLAGFNFATDMGMSEQLDVRFVNCGEAVASGVETMTCDWSMDFTFLAGTVSAQEGTATMTTADGMITSVEMVSTNFDQVASELSLYRGWVDLGPESVNALFTPFGTLWISGDLADRHAVAAADFLEATDVASDPAKIGNVLMAALRVNDEGTVDRLFGPSGEWNEPSFQLEREQVVELLLGGVSPLGDLATFEFTQCVAAAEVVSCDLLLTYASIPGLGVIPGTVDIEVEDGQVGSVDITYDEPGRSEYLAGMLDYQAYVQEVTGVLDPGAAERMFINEELMHVNPESLALHDQYGPEWSAQLSG